MWKRPPERAAIPASYTPAVPPLRSPRGSRPLAVCRRLRRCAWPVAPRALCPPAPAANPRTAEAAREGGIRKALPLAFRGGAVMGFSVAGLGLLGLALGFLVFVEWLEV